jgi:hypothetical protein
MPTHIVWAIAITKSNPCSSQGMWSCEFKKVELELERLYVQMAAAPRAPQNLQWYLEKFKLMPKFPILLILLKILVS